jgi:hypothetical protein
MTAYFAAFLFGSFDPAVYMLKDVGDHIYMETRPNYIIARRPSNHGARGNVSNCAPLVEAPHNFLRKYATVPLV